MENLELIKKWLNLFWDSAVFILNKEWNILTRNTPINIKKYFSLENAVSFNNSLPYQLAFSPNGNLWKVNVVGQDVLHSKENAEDYVAALVIDLDMDKSSYGNKQDYLNYIIKKIESSRIKISYLVETGRWFHAYIFIREQDRYVVWKMLKGNKFKLLECELAKMFDGWDKSSHSIVKLMRLPFSHYWKWYPSNLGEFICKLRKLTRNDSGELAIEEVTDPEQITLDWIEIVWTRWIDSYLKSIKDEEESYNISYEGNNSADATKFNATCSEVNK